jgi:glycosyltransferase involved in cell wall biosynthesis
LRRKELSPNSIFFAYDTSALETMEWLHERNILCVLNQMDPSRVEINLVREEESRWPGWQEIAVSIPEEYLRRREQEWALADRVVVNSEFSRQALVEQGVPPEKLSVVPLCYEGGNTELLPNARPKNKSLRVLWLGQVILRKGIQYLLAAARLLSGENVQFEIVGPIGISRDAIASAPSNVTFHGRVSRDQIGTWYQQADVFVLPTISDGFALTQLEAMAHGLPVIATPNCGDVVSHMADGLIVPPRDAQALARAIHSYLTDPELLRLHQTAAPGKARQFSLRHLADNLHRLEMDLRGIPNPDQPHLSHSYV